MRAQDPARGALDALQRPEHERARAAVPGAGRSRSRNHVRPPRDCEGMADTFPGSDPARVPPHNLEAERFALGGVLVKPVMFEQV